MGYSRMSELEVTLMIIGVTGTFSSILFAYLAFRRADRKEDKVAGKNEGILISDLGYIKSSTERIEKRLDKLDNGFTDLNTRVSILENDVKNLSKRNSTVKETRNI